MTESAIRGAVILAAVSYLRTPYRWGGKDASKDGGLDCSGYAEVCLGAGGIRLPEMNADTLWKTLTRIDEAQVMPGDLAFYGDAARAHHVVVVLGTNGKAIIGANGGGPPLGSESPDDYAARMARQDAAVRIEDWRKGGARYRNDFLGYCRLPVETSALYAKDGQ